MTDEETRKALELVANTLSGHDEASASWWRGRALDLARAVQRFAADRVTTNLSSDAYPITAHASRAVINSVIRERDDARRQRDDWADAFNREAVKLRATLRDLRDVQTAAGLVEEARRDLEQALEAATGPHCPSCGNAIDPDTCWCGDACDRHYDPNVGHAFVTMGCDCARHPADRDWKKAARALRELAWQTANELERVKAQLAARDVPTCKTCGERFVLIHAGDHPCPIDEKDL